MHTVCVRVPALQYVGSCSFRYILCMICAMKCIQSVQRPFCNNAEIEGAKQIITIRGTSDMAYELEHATRIFFLFAFYMRFDLNFCFALMK